ncbi:hypothetical protein O3M35_010434 [Rhynocoris fuscipes]|uniref:Uncharacterized protein n=1 Tax=Rhynocoris fuscipes TaxID=488301 RepID=A0AAW1D6L6_9HEMI
MQQTVCRESLILAYVGKSYNIIKVISFIGGQFMYREHHIVFASCTVMGLLIVLIKKGDNYKCI